MRKGVAGRLDALAPPLRKGPRRALAERPDQVGRARSLTSTRRLPIVNFQTAPPGPVFDSHPLVQAGTTVTLDERVQRRIADLERKARSRPEDRELLSQLVRAYLEGGRLHAAVSRVEAQLSLGIDFELIELACEANRRAGNPERGLELLETSWPKTDTAPYWTLRGRLLESLGQLEQALQSHEKALKIEPDRIASIFRHGVTLMRLERDREALLAFERCVELDPAMIKAQINIGVILDQMGDPRRAIEAFEKALAVDSRSVETRCNLGASYGDLGMKRQAIAEFQRALELDPSCVLAHFNLGVALMEEKPEEAQAALKHALAIDPAHWEAAYHLGVLYFKTGMYEAAVRLLQQCLKAHPDSIRALYHLGLAYNKKDQPGRAIECLNRVCELDPENSRAHYYLGVAHDKKGQYEKALLCYQAADRLGTNG